MGIEQFSEIPEGHTILITGGTGFIATNLAEKLASTNKLILFDKYIEGSPLTFSDVREHPNVRVVQGDILDFDAVEAVVREADVIFHLAAIVGVNRVIERSRDTINVNFLGTSNILRATEAHPGVHRFIYFSTSEVFGANSFRVGEGTYCSIGSVTEARWSYSIAKLAGEHLLHAYHRDFGLPSVIVRPFNVFGPLRTGDHAMQRFILAALRGEDLEVHGDGSQIRSWCYVDDFVDAVIRMIDRPQAIGEDFNIGNPVNTITIYDLAKKVIDAVGSSSRVDFVKIDFSDIDIRVPRTEKARKLLDFVPVHEMDQAIALTAEWYRENLNAFSPAASKRTTMLANA